MRIRKRRRKQPETPLTAEYVREILDYDPYTGKLHWRSRMTFSVGWNTRWTGKEAGFLVRGHIHIQVNGANYYAHRLAWLLYYGTWPPQQIDHINGVRDDNRISNLRLATHGENCRNRAMQSNNQSGYIGVHFDHQRGLWRAKINLDRKLVFSASFATADEAAEARDKALAAIHGAFARFNKPRERK